MYMYAEDDEVIVAISEACIFLQIKISVKMPTSYGLVGT